MFVLLLSLVACIGRADEKVKLDREALADKKIKLTNLQVELNTHNLAIRDTQYTFEPDAWLVLKGRFTQAGLPRFQHCRFVQTHNANHNMLIFRFQKKGADHEIMVTIAEFEKMVQNFQVFVPLTPTLKEGETPTVRINSNSPSWANTIRIGGLLSPWRAHNFVAFNPTMRGMFLITGSGKANVGRHKIGKTNMYEFFGINNPDKDGQGDLVFLEAGTPNSKRKDDHDAADFKAKIMGRGDFEALIRQGRVAVPVQNVLKKNYYVEYGRATYILGHYFGIKPVYVAHVEKNSKARAREDADYYRYGGYAYDDERDYAYDYYEDEEEDEEYNAYGQGFEAGYRAALEIVMNKLRMPHAHLFILSPIVIVTTVLVLLYSVYWEPQLSGF